MLSIAKAILLMLTLPSMSYYISSNPLSKFKKEIVFFVCGHHCLTAMHNDLVFISTGVS